MKKLGSIADINASSLKKGHEPNEINYIDIASVSTGQIDKIEHLAYADALSRARRVVKSGDIIWSTVRFEIQIKSGLTAIIGLFSLLM